MDIITLIALAVAKITEALKDKKVTVGEALDLLIAEIMAAGDSGDVVIHIDPKIARKIRQALTIIKKSLNGGDYTKLELANIVKGAFEKYGLLSHTLFELKK